MVKAMYGQEWVGGVLRRSVLSSPVRLRKARQFEAWHGIVERGPVRLGQAVLGSVKCTKVRRFMARLCGAEFCHAWYAKVLSWLGEVLLGVVGFIGVLYSLVRSYCGVVWSVEVLHGIVKFCPVMYSVAVQAKAFLRRGIVRYRTAVSGFGRLRAVLQALVLFGGVTLGGQLFGGAMHGNVWSGYGHVRYET